MAKIEMDVTEYDAMRKNTELLEASLLKEETLNQQIKDLQQQNIEDLKQNSMRIVKVKTTEVRQFILRKRPDDEIITQMRRIFYDSGYQNHHSSYNFDTIIQQIEDAFFQLQEATSSSGEHSVVTVHGLDEVKEELRTEERAKVADEVDGFKNEVRVMKQTAEDNKTKLLDANIKGTENKSFKREIEKLKDEVTNTAEENAELLAHIDDNDERIMFNANKMGRALEQLKHDSLFARKQTISNARAVLSEIYVKTKEK